MARSDELTEYERDRAFVVAMRFLLECREEALRRRGVRQEAEKLEVSPEKAERAA